MNYKMHNKIRKLGEEHSRYFLVSTIGISHGSLDNIKGEKLLKIYKIKNILLFNSIKFKKFIAF